MAPQPTPAPLADRDELQTRVSVAACADPRIVGLLDYGSHSEGRGDEWSDVDLAVFIKDEDFDGFETDWVTWAGWFGRLLLAFVGDIGNHWTVYDGAAKPIRADFALHRASAMPSLLNWPNAPLSVAHMVLVDKTDGTLSALVAQTIGRDLGPPDLPHRFERGSAFRHRFHRAGQSDGVAAARSGPCGALAGSRRRREHRAGSQRGSSRATQCLHSRSDANRSGTCLATHRPSRARRQRRGGCTLWVSLAGGVGRPRD